LDEERNRWLHCNDARVSIVTEDNVAEAEAYILFYNRREELQIPAFAPLKPVVGSFFTSPKEEKN
jgi:hypothetical protein